MSDNREVEWTAKLPALLGGLVLILAGMIATARGRLILAAVLLALGGAFLTYSLTIKDWCHLRGAEYGRSAWGQGGFGGGIGDCLREKTWLQF